MADILRGNEIFRVRPPEPLIEGVLDVDSTVLFYGSKGVGKSVMGLDWACSIATGKAWDGHRVNRGKVIYILGEGLTGTVERYRAWLRHHQVDEVRDIVWVTEAFNIFHNKDRDELMQLVTDEQPNLTVFDTIARHMTGHDENAPADMSEMAEVLEQVKRFSGGCALGIHHPGKNESAGSRGHTCLTASVDTELHYRKDRTLFVEKQRNHPDHIVLGRYELIRVGSSVVASRVGDWRGTMLELLPPEGLTGPEWMKVADLKRSTFYDRVAILIREGLVTDTDDRYRSAPN